MSEIKIPQSLLNVIADVNINEINSHIYTNESLTNWLCAWREEIKRELYDFANNHELYQQGISDERPKAFAKGYDSGYQQGRADATKEMDLATVYAKGRADAIDECAKVVSSMVGICQSFCPIDCNWGTEESCVESWKTYLAEQLKENK